MKTYALHISVAQQIAIQIGKLGRFSFPPGHYVYVGSAKRNMDARIARHKSSKKKLRWHIDYLLNSPHAKIVEVILSEKGECELNQSIKGDVIVKGFGSSDCQSRCKSHLKFVSSSLRPPLG
ncbi:MAG: GIY-YIG nuclease family protein [Myxococcota bacterium]|nr:GIY-YIG nuclease family protein [Myxococcota bacterium]